MPKTPLTLGYLVMPTSPENEEENNDPHPYWYAHWHIIGNFHANVRHIGPDSKSREPVQMDFFFVHWFGRDSDPGCKCVQVLPLYTKVLKFLHRLRFADRDLMMRFRGSGVGHKSTRQATDFFKKDRHVLDMENSLESRKDIVEELVETNDSNESVNMVVSSDSEVGDEEDDYGYQLGEDHSDSEEEKGSDDDSELGEEDFGLEDNGLAVDSDMEDLGYAEL